MHIMPKVRSISSCSLLRLTLVWNYMGSVIADYFVCLDKVDSFLLWNYMGSVIADYFVRLVCGLTRLIRFWFWSVF